MKPTRDADDSEATQSEGEDEETETESENGPELFRCVTELHTQHAAHSC
jgi:hypothetical protein